MALVEPIDTNCIYCCLFGRLKIGTAAILSSSKIQELLARAKTSINVMREMIKGKERAVSLVVTVVSLILIYSVTQMKRRSGEKKVVVKNGVIFDPEDQSSSPSTSYSYYSDTYKSDVQPATSSSDNLRVSPASPSTPLPPSKILERIRKGGAILILILI